MSIRVLSTRPAILTALVAAALAAGIAFIAGPAPDARRAEYAPTRVATAVFAGGCFWCVEADFDTVDGVVETVTGYIGGTTERPDYQTVAAGGTDYYEAVKVTYDPARISYDRLAAQFLRFTDPTEAGADACSLSETGATAIFIAAESERMAASSVLAEAESLLGRAVTTEILPRTAFWPAEDAYQDVHLRNPAKYARQRAACDRDARLDALWGPTRPAL